MSQSSDKSAQMRATLTGSMRNERGAHQRASTALLSNTGRLESCAKSNGEKIKTSLAIGILRQVKMGVEKNEQGMCLGRQKGENNKEIITIKHTEGQYLVSDLSPSYSDNIQNRPFMMETRALIAQILQVRKSTQSLPVCQDHV